MILVDHQIDELCRAENLITPYRQEMLNPASLDLTIGSTLKRETVWGGWRDVDLSSYSCDRPYWLYPGQFILAGTSETFKMPPTVAAEFKLKSSRAREGYEHLNAGFADPEWQGSVLTMEIKNVRQYKRLPLYPGLRIGQMIFFECDRPSRTYQQTGRYNNHTTVMESLG